MRRRWKAVFLLNLVILSCIAITVLSVRLAKSSNLPSEWDVFFPSDHPEKNLIFPEKYHRSTAECPLHEYTDFIAVPVYDLGNFSFSEVMDPHDNPEFSHGKINGNLEIRPAPYGQEASIEVWLNVATTKSWKGGVPDIRRSRNELQINFPKYLQRVATSQDHEYREAPPCMDVWVGIYVSPGLENLHVKSDNLDVDVGYPRSMKTHRMWTLRVANATTVSAVRDVSVSSLDSRMTSIETINGSVSGFFILYDSLSVTSQHGYIYAEIVQAFATHKNSSRRQADLAAQGYSRLRDPDTPSVLRTMTGIGQQSIVLLQQLRDWSNLPRGYDPYGLNSYHYSSSGSITLEYSPWWVGNIDGTAVNGSIELDCDGIEVLFSDDYHIEARRRLDYRSGVSNLTFYTQQGNVSMFLEDGYGL